MAGGLPHPVLLSTIFKMDEITIAGQAVEFKHVFFTCDRKTKSLTLPMGVDAFNQTAC